ncbi:hypothetical protein Tcan_06102 [Toxocara canis]|uniref:G-protein coupled receptors family 1 profile domain-containing protein n=1 Tax=Toxocara canis TaxID=6265 RepID=A0A0B2V9B4_TOXCA|nr:hypothetical protein Tcan_06102 [Toxocara canis]
MVVEENAVIRLIGGAAFSVLSSFGLITNVLLISTFVKAKNFLKSNFFYILAYQLALCDFLVHISQIGVVIPACFISSAQFYAYQSTLIFKLLANCDTIGFYGTLHFTFVIVISRYTVIASRGSNIVFRPPCIYILIAAVWISTAGLVAIEVCLCPKNFDYFGLYLFKDCRNSGMQGQCYNSFTYFWTLSPPIAMFLIYICIFIKLRKMSTTTVSSAVPNEHSLPEGAENSAAHSTVKDKGTERAKQKQPQLLSFAKRANCTSLTQPSYKSTDIENNSQRIILQPPKRLFRKRETNFFMQAAIICAVLELEIIVFYLFPVLGKLLPEGADIWLSVVQNCCVIINNSVQPTIYFIFNSEIRNALKKLFICH